MGNKWNRNKIIVQIRWLLRPGNKITPQEIRRDYGALFFAADRGGYFNNWRQAVAAAGMLKRYDKLVQRQQELVLLRRKRVNVWSRELIKKKIMSLYRKGIALDGGNIRKYYYNLLHAAENRRYFGSWRTAVESIGVDYDDYIIKRRKQGQRAKYRFSDKVTRQAIKSWVRWLRERNYAAVTIRGNINCLCSADRYLRGLKIEKVTAGEIARFISSFTMQRLSPHTIYNKYHVLRKFFDFSLKKGFIKNDPTKNMAAPLVPTSIPSIIGKEEMRKLLIYLDRRECKNEFIRFRDKLLFKFIMFCGLRRNELLNIRINDISLEEKTLFIRQGKGRKDRIVPIHDQLAKDLVAYRRLRGSSPVKNLLLINDKRSKMTAGYLNHIYRRTKALAGLRGEFSPKVFRSTFATMLYENSVSLRSIQELMGHSRIGTTAEYIRVSVNYLREEIKRHPLLIRGD
jgi:site-specific recombinase XerD